MSWLNSLKVELNAVDLEVLYISESLKEIFVYKHWPVDRLWQRYLVFDCWGNRALRCLQIFVGLSNNSICINTQVVVRDLLSSLVLHACVVWLTVADIIRDKWVIVTSWGKLGSFRLLEFTKAHDERCNRISWLIFIGCAINIVIWIVIILSFTDLSSFFISI